MESFTMKKNNYVERIAAYVLSNGIGESSLKKMATAAETSDRMLMHYFKDKEEIMTLVLKSINRDLISLLNSQSSLKLPFIHLLNFISKAINDPNIQPYLTLWFELAQLSSSGDEPYTSVAKEIGDSYKQWLIAVYEPKTNENADEMTALLYALTEGFVFLNKIQLHGTINLAQTAMAHLYSQGQQL